MRYFRTSFRAGNVVTEAGRFRFKTEFALGNGWRGILVGTGIVLLVKGLWELGLISLGFAGLWSCIEQTLRSWRKTVLQEKAIILMKEDKIEEVLEICGIPEPGSSLWWMVLSIFFKKERWSEAAKWLEELDEGNERDYLMAVARIGGKQPQKALLLCPTKAEGDWLTVKTEALFQMQEWEQVLALLRRSSPGRVHGSQDVEHVWLKGGCYYFLGRYKSAARLLGYVSRHGGADYGSTGVWLQDAAAKKEV